MAGAGTSGSGGQGGAPSPLDCTGHAPPGGLKRQNTFSLASNTQLWAASNTEWSQNATLDLTLWNPTPRQFTQSGQKKPTLGLFAQNPGDTATIELQSGNYASFQIETTGLSGKAGQLASEQPASNGAPLYLTLSACAGDPLPDDPRCRSQVSALASLGWSIGETGATNYCPLAPGMTYHLNVFFLDPATPGQSTCTTPSCWWLVTTNCQTGCE
jgi:hypothetical protein